MQQAIRLEYGRVVDIPRDVAPQAQLCVWNAIIARLNLQTAEYKGLAYVKEQMLDEWAELEKKLAVANVVARDETDAERLGLLPA
jgi:hypothetical protein